MIRILVAETLVQMLTDLPKLIAGGVKELESIDLHNHLEIRHLIR